MEKFEIKQSTHTHLIKYRDEKNVQNVVIPDGIDIIDGGAFYGCKNVVSVHIPPSVYRIDDNAFNNCPNLMEFSVDEKNESYCTVDGNLHAKYNNKVCWCEKIPDGKSHVKITSACSETAFSEWSNFHTLTVIKNPEKKPIILYRHEVDVNGEYSGVFMSRIMRLMMQFNFGERISHEVKDPIIIEMYLNGWFDDERYNSCEWFKNFMPNNFSKIFKGFIDREDDVNIKKIIDSEKLLTSRNITSYIRYADSQGAYSICDMLENYKNKLRSENK
ncbi:MAG: leucine-rich repeat domain-containing protein [Prevotella sp.]|nr:leucine-rich repeat domain-containing protein [Alistipes senegalensis]MCM1358737.1 leucine-rich repeat domain-containing protein [Prevotella sp.]MCM1474433.1 leucine-rich repeat domain-containing protein [Muribaculaceae bacterium]